MSVAAHEKVPVALTRTENSLIQVQGMFSAALAIASVFLSLYLFKVGGFRSIALFYVAQYLLMPPAFIVSGYLMRTRTTKYVIRLGLLILCGLFVLLLILGSNARHVPLLLGALMGIGEGIYWPGINLSEYIATHSKTRNLYYGKLFFVGNIASVVGLPLSGIVITLSRHFSSSESGYYILFGLLILLLLFTHHLGAQLAPWTGLDFSVNEMKRHVRSKEWKLVLAQNVLRGTWAYALPAFASVLLYLIVKSELSLSVLSAATTVLVGAASFVAGKLLQRYPSTFLVGAVVVPIGMIGFALQQNWIGILFYSLLVLSFDPFAQNFTYAAMYNVMDAQSTSWKTGYHFIVEREIAWNLGRVISFLGVLWILGSDDQVHALTQAIISASVIPLVVGCVQYWLHRLTITDAA